MKCVRCNKEFDSINVQTYGGHAIFACPHCGKPYSFSRRIIIDTEPINYDCGRKFDDWGNKIIVKSRKYEESNAVFNNDDKSAQE